MPQLHPLHKLMVLGKDALYQPLGISSTEREPLLIIGRYPKVSHIHITQHKNVGGILPQHQQLFGSVPIYSGGAFLPAGIECG